MRFSNQAKIIAFSAIFSWSSLMPRANADVVYSQPPQDPSGGYTTYTSAFTDPYLDYYQTLSSFQLTSSSTIGAISWQGIYLNYDQTNGYTNGDPNTNNWVISLYTSGGASDFPFTPYSVETVSSTDVTESLAGTANFEGTQVNYYNESLTLPTSVSLQGGQTYFLSIFSDNGGSSDSWSWLSSTNTDGQTLQYESNSDSTGLVAGNRTFTLYSQAVPEPASVSLLLIGGVFSLALYARQCRRARGYVFLERRLC
jgi:hypothetical protein